MQRSLQQRKRRIRLLAITALVILALIFSIWTLLLVLYPTNEAPRMSFFRWEWVIESVSCYIARIDNGSAVEAPESGIFVPFVRERESVAAGDLIGLVAPESLFSQIDAYRDARNMADRASYLASGVGLSKKDEVSILPGDSLMRAAYRDLAKAPKIGNLDTYQDTLLGLYKAFNRSVLEYVSSGSQDESVIALEKTCDEMKAKLQRSVNPTALIFAQQAGIVQYSFVPDTYNWDENDWLQCADPEAQIEQIVSRSEIAINLAYQSVRKGSPIGSIDALGGGQLMVVFNNPVDEVLKYKAGDTVALYLPENDTVVKNLRIKKTEKSKTLARYIFTYSSDQASMFRQADNKAQFVLSRARGWVVPIRSLFVLSYDQSDKYDTTISPSAIEERTDTDKTTEVNGMSEGATVNAETDPPATDDQSTQVKVSNREKAGKETYDPIDPNTVHSGGLFGLKMISGGRVYCVHVRVLAADGQFAVIESDEPEGSMLPLPDERALYVVNPWSIAEGALID